MGVDGDVDHEPLNANSYAAAHTDCEPPLVECPCLLGSVGAQTGGPTDVAEEIHARLDEARCAELVSPPARVVCPVGGLLFDEHTAGPTTSGMLVLLIATTGVPQLMASSGGRPWPSYADGKTKTRRQPSAPGAPSR